MYHLSEALRFPSPHLATEEGIVAVGGDLRPERVLLAYQKGIFPWFEKDDFLIWWSPDPRMVLFPLAKTPQRSGLYGWWTRKPTITIFLSLRACRCIKTIAFKIDYAGCI